MRPHRAAGGAAAVPVLSLAACLLQAAAEAVRLQTVRPLASFPQNGWHSGIGRGGSGATEGARVLVFGLRSAIQLNGQEGRIRGFDALTGRYAVQMSKGGHRVKIRPKNLRSLLLPGVREGWAPLGGGGAPAQRGMRVVLGGLTHARSLNGRTGTIRTFDFGTERYVVELPGHAPRRIRPENLRPLGAAGGGRSALRSGAGGRGASEGAASICRRQDQAAAAGTGPGAFARGTRVVLRNLTSKVAVARGWNGLAAVVHCFDKSSGRYVVELPDGTPRRVRPEHLLASGASSVGASTSAGATSAASGRRAVWLPGSLARLVGLRKALRLNSQVVKVRGFDNTTHRYVVQTPDGKLKRVKAEHLAAAAPPQKVPEDLRRLRPQAPATPTPRLSVCNAYAAREPLQVFATSAVKRDQRRPTQVVRDLAFQSCIDVMDLPSAAGRLAFVVGRLQVASLPLNASLNATPARPRHGLGLTVFRGDVNSLKASIHQSDLEVRGDGAFYELRVVDAYAGSRLLQLHVHRGAFAKQVPLGGTYRLTREEPIELALTDGYQSLKLGFQPRRSRTYCVVLTGVDAGLRGEPRNVGLVAHELGAWTSSEEMSRGQGRASAPLPTLSLLEKPIVAPASASATRKDWGPSSWLAQRLSGLKMLLQQ